MALVWRLLHNGDVWGWAACAFFSPTADESTPQKHFLFFLLHHSFNKKQNCINNFTYENYATLDTPNLSKLFESAQPTTKHVHNFITVSIHAVTLSANPINGIINIDTTRAESELEL